MQFQVLGYYGGYPTATGGTSGYLLRSGTTNVLLDAGSGVLSALEKVMDPLQLDAVVLSHYHHDHTADVGVLQYLWQLKPGAKKEPQLPIYGNTQNPIEFATLTWPGATVGRPYTDNSPLTIGSLTFTFQRTIHPVPAFAMRITDADSGHVLAFTADTRYYPELADFVKNADVLITDTNFLNGHQGPAWHMTAGQSGELAKNAKVGRLLLSHLPQTESLAELKKQAEETAGTIKVALASDSEGWELV
ncbi:MBL fold metallo-hydrolase [Schleiferilactobacillus shenzhenensis]|uniref:YhfI n=1 Tax=Schleiferilactobacillus shenzhenensis LY-73 TaxID=1231336 RepID=U4TMP2_9LACO|nr:MBL fold metallo-hydrolase [Schleiferilactobacillus shenzhenensis]ERL66156.1 YhfI [Schleiferilactobacillus shenzhenensis LY-73]